MTSEELSFWNKVYLSYIKRGEAALEAALLADKAIIYRRASAFK